MAMSLSRVIWRLGSDHSGGNGLICWMPIHFERLMRDAVTRFSMNENGGRDTRLKVSIDWGMFQ